MSVCDWRCMAVESSPSPRSTLRRRPTCRVVDLYSNSSFLDFYLMTRRMSDGLRRHETQFRWLSASRKKIPRLTPLSTLSSLFTGQAIRKLVKDGVIAKKEVAMHSRARARANAEAKAKGRHQGFGKRKGTREARMPTKVCSSRGRGAVYSASEAESGAGSRFLLPRRLPLLARRHHVFRA